MSAQTAPTPANRAAKRARMKTVAISAGVVLYLTAASLGVVYGSAAIYQLMHKQAPHDLTLTSSYDMWQEAKVASDTREPKKFKLALGVPAAAFFVALPMMLFAMTGQGRELHGSARFARPMEVEKSGLLGTQGIILGKYRGRFLLMDGELSVMLAAPPGAGKGVGVVVPNLLAWPESTVILDVKPELFRLTAGYRAAHGQAVFAWSPFDKNGDTHRYNPLHYVRTDFRYVVGDLLNIAQTIYAGKADDSSSSSFFLGNARNMFLAIGLYLVETPELPRTIGEILRQASGKGRPIKEHLQALVDDRKNSDRPLSGRCVDAFNRVLSSADDTFTGIVNTLNEPLTLFTDALVDASTSGNDFDLRELRRKLMSVYVMIPVNRIEESKVLLNLFYSQLLKLNTAEDHENDKSIKYHLLMVDDEFATMGRVNAFAVSIGYLRSFWIRLLTIVQSPAQLEYHYGKEVTEAFTTCHGARVLFTPRSQRDAEAYSAFLGNFTEKSQSKSQSSNHGKHGGGSSSTSTSPQKRPLLLPQEFKELGNDKEIILVDDVHPILADKIRYYEDEVFMGRLMAPPVLPRIDLELYMAQIEQRVRTVIAGEDFDLTRVVADFKNLPTVSANASDAEIHALVNGFLDQMLVSSVDETTAAETADDEGETEVSTSGDAGGPEVLRTARSERRANRQAQRRHAP